MVKVLVHAGFHKTGTTSLQAYLNAHRRALKPYADIYLKPDFANAAFQTRAFGQKPFWWRRLMFRRSFRHFLNDIPTAQTVVLSWEGFCGIMPGHRRVTGKPAKSYAKTAVPLAKEVRRALRKRFGPDTEITFLYTTRAPDSWLRSIWGHLVRSIDLRTDFDGFKTQFGQTDIQAQDIARLRLALGDNHILTASLEDMANRHAGPATAIFDVLDCTGWVEDNLPPAQVENPGHGAALETAYLHTNRKSDKTSGKTIKMDLAQKAAYQARHEPETK